MLLALLLLPPLACNDGLTCGPGTVEVGGIDLDSDGRRMVYDNVWDAERSRAMELALDTAAMTATLTGSFTEDGWYEPICGDAVTLPSGHKLINMAHACGIFANATLGPELLAR